MKYYQYNFGGKYFGELIPCKDDADMQAAVCAAIYDAMVKASERVKIELKLPLPIHFAPVDRAGRVHFYCCQECFATGEKPPLGFYQVMPMN